MNNQHLLIVDDDVNFCLFVKDYLVAQGFEVDVVHDGPAMKDYLNTHSIDLILLDVMLPGEDGLSLARYLRSEMETAPIIMLSAAGEEVDRIVGLEIGADDYLGKPVSLRELLARIRAVLRRGGQAVTATTAEVSKPTVYPFGPFSLETSTHRLLKDNQEIVITHAEYSLLLAFVTHPNQVLTRDRLMNLVKGYDHTPFDRSIDVRVSRLRNKIEIDAASPTYIRTIRGEGYLFSPQG